MLCRTCPSCQPESSARRCGMESVCDVDLKRKRLEREAYWLRQEAIRMGNMEAWCLARKLRDASTPEQISAMDWFMEQFREAPQAL